MDHATLKQRTTEIRMITMIRVRLYVGNLPYLVGHFGGKQGRLLWTASRITMTGK